jgi:hypothetical protein
MIYCSSLAREYFIVATPQKAEALVLVFSITPTSWSDTKASKEFDDDRSQQGQHGIMKQS